MSSATPQAKTLYDQANQVSLKLSELAARGTLTKADKAKMTEQSIDLYTQALNLGLGKKDEVWSRLSLGALLFGIASSDDLARVSKEGITKLPVLLQSMEEFEKALKLDAELPEPILHNRSQQAAHLTRLDFLWSYNAIYIKKHGSGINDAVSFLAPKLILLRYLHNVHLPITSFFYGRYNTETGLNMPLGMEWLEKCIEADDYADIFESQGWIYEAIVKWKKDARHILEYDNPKPVPKKAAPVQKQSICFIATATFDSPDAPEVVALRAFRDQTLLTSKTGQHLVNLYYLMSPPIAKVIAQSPLLKQVSRELLSRLVRKLPE